MTAKFILSLDCEGKWGGADKQALPHHRALTDESLRWAYKSVLRLLDQYNIPATFAFVGTFVMDEQERAEAAPDLTQLGVSSPYVKAALERKDDDGWFGKWTVDAAHSANTRHEVALHGVTHAPWGALSKQQAELEISILRHAKALQGVKTFIFPRNEVAHLDVLKAAGIIGYRAAKKYSLPAGHMIDEINPFVPADRDPSVKPGEMIAIPSGFFINWKNGPRKAIPTWLSSLRAGNLIRSSREGEVVHYWTHPENIASAPSTLRVLKAVVERAARARDRGLIEIVTQFDYCKRLQAA